ncbi:MAG TPA: glycosyltransferase, partial [Gemmataceae bacterium]|nr:glycosyltransferase [Gemmataceae bacterium]
GFLQQTRQDWEIMFVCDGCTDGTPSRLVELAGADHPQVRVLSHTPNRGKGYAVRRGLAAARGEWRLFTDVDLAYRFDDVLRVLHHLQAGADLAIACRLHADTRVTAPTRLLGYVYARHLQSLAFSALVRTLLPIQERDTQAGLKGMSARAARLLLPQLRCNGFGFDCELLMACRHHRLTVAEVPVHVRYDTSSSTTGMRAMSRMIRELLGIRRAWKAPTSPPEEVIAPPRRQAA